MMVHCVLCHHDPEHDDVVHIFSSRPLAEQFMERDARKRSHVYYDYEIDRPQRMEPDAVSPTQ